MSSGEAPEPPQEPGQRVYAVRFSPRAEREATEALAHIARTSGDPEQASVWFSGLLAFIGTLATQPFRTAIRPRESRLIGEAVRAVLYRRTSNSRAAFYAFYTVEETSDDGPRVTVIHIRHASRKPLTRREARDIKPEA